MSEFLKACRGEHTSHTPIWLMRQAGRYQKEYRAIRERVSFLELCATSELAAEVTVMAVEQLGVDAGIIFADILLPLKPLGVDFGFEAGHGPKIYTPIRSVEQVELLSEHIDAADSLSYVCESIRLFKKAKPDTPIIGFAGAPFTLAAYCIEGGGSRNYLTAKSWMLSHPEAFHQLMTKLVDATIQYLNAQIQAGADVVQLFDSWVGSLGPRDYVTHVLPHMTRLIAGLDKSVPCTHFGTGNPQLIPLMHQAGADVLGIDWRINMTDAWNTSGATSMMGNMDPAYLLAPRDVMLAEAKRILDEIDGRPGHIFNLGHGIMPQAQVPQVQALVEFVKSYSQR